MKASETRLQPVIEGAKQYVVPLFQRPYSWDKKHWQDLWDDLVELCEESQPRIHFIGSIVTMPSQSVPEGVPKYVLIDGQQRLTTLLILLALIRDNAATLPGTLANQIDHLLLFNKYQEGLDEYKLLPTQVDRETFTRLMKRESVQGDNQIVKAYKFFEKCLRSQPEIELNTLKKVIVGSLGLVSIILEREDNPYLIFESLNAKGRPLAQADLIRNYFFMRMHPKDQEKHYAAFWKPMQERLKDDLTEFIRHFLMKDALIVKQGDVYLEMKDRADTLSDAELIDFLKTLCTFSGYYERLLHAEREPNPKLRERLERLNRIEVTTAYPFLLNLYHDLSGSTLSEPQALAILDVLENFVIRRFVCSVPTHSLNKLFPALYGQAKQGDSLLEGVKTVLSTKNYPRDAEFVARFTSAKLYAGGDRTRTKLILERLEASYEHMEPVAFDTLTIEHVMPQTLNAWWREHLGDDWEDVHSTWLDTIGNLTLSGYNSPLGNADFPYKRSLYEKSHVEITRHLATAEKWDAESIRGRASFLAAHALKVWKHFANNPDEEQVEEPLESETFSEGRIPDGEGRIPGFRGHHPWVPGTPSLEPGTPYMVLASASRSEFRGHRTWYLPRLRGPGRFRRWLAWHASLLPAFLISP